MSWNIHNGKLSSKLFQTVHGLKHGVLRCFAKHSVSGGKWGTFREDMDLDVAAHDHHVGNINLHGTHLLSFYDGHLTHRR